MKVLFISIYLLFSFCFFNCALSNHYISTKTDSGSFDGKRIGLFLPAETGISNYTNRFQNSKSIKPILDEIFLRIAKTYLDKNPITSYEIAACQTKNVELKTKERNFSFQICENDTTSDSLSLAIFVSGFQITEQGGVAGGPDMMTGGGARTAGSSPSYKVKFSYLFFDIGNQSPISYGTVETVETGFINLSDADFNKAISASVKELLWRCPFSHKNLNETMP